MVSKQALTSAGNDFEFPSLEISESFTGDNGFYADRKFKMVDSEGQNCFENL
jgi:hypothetical protein